MDEHFYSGLANELEAKLRRVSSFVSHNPSIGAYHEEALRAVLRHMLSDRFSLKTGFVWYSKDEASRQGDIIVVDESKAGAYYFREGDFAILDSSAVACVIEVKTVLTKATFLEGIVNLASFHRPRGGILPSFLFAYEASPFTPVQLDEWYKEVTLADSLLFYHWAIFALNQGIISTWKDSAGQWAHRLLMGDSTHPTKLRSLSFFLQTFRKALLLHAGEEKNPFEHMLWQGMSLSQQAFRFGHGATEAAPMIIG